MPSTRCERRFTPAFRELMRFEVERARALFARGLPLLTMVPKRLRLDLALFARGGQTPRIEAPVGPLSGNLTIA